MHVRSSALLAPLLLAAWPASAQVPAQRVGAARVDSLAAAGIAPLNLAYAPRLAGRHNPPSALLLAPGNRVSFCPALSCVDAPSTDHQRATLLVSAETQDDGHSEEQTVGILTTVGTGAYRAWTPSTAYALGDNVTFQDGRNAVYRTVQAGTSAAAGQGPSGKGSAIQDGTVVWAWINDAAINAKVGLYNEVQVAPGGGNSWAQANNLLLRAGTRPLFHANTEMDFTNDSGTDCAAGVANCLGLYVRMGGTNRSTSGISVEGLGAGALFGLRMAGPLAANAAISLGTTGGQAGLGIGDFTAASYSVAAINDASTAPAALNVAGTKSLTAIRIAATAPSALDLRDGTYSGAQVLGQGWSVGVGGAMSVSGLTVAGNVYETGGLIPPTSTTACTAGQRAWDQDYEYRCVAANTWKRAALSSW